MSAADEMIDGAGFGKTRTRLVGPAYKCRHCGERFGNRALLKIHVNKEHVEADADFAYTNFLQAHTGIGAQGPTPNPQGEAR